MLTPNTKPPYLLEMEKLIIKIIGNTFKNLRKDQHHIPPLNNDDDGNTATGPMGKANIQKSPFLLMKILQTYQTVNYNCMLICNCIVNSYIILFSKVKYH